MIAVDKHAQQRSQTLDPQGTATTTTASVNQNHLKTQYSVATVANQQHSRVRHNNKLMIMEGVNALNGVGIISSFTQSDNNQQPNATNDQSSHRRTIQKVVTNEGVETWQAFLAQRIQNQIQTQYQDGFLPKITTKGGTPSRKTQFTQHQKQVNPLQNAINEANRGVNEFSKETEQTQQEAASPSKYDLQDYQDAKLMTSMKFKDITDDLDIREALHTQQNVMNITRTTFKHRINLSTNNSKAQLQTALNLGMPLHTDKIISYQSFSPGNLVKKHKGKTPMNNLTMSEGKGLEKGNKLMRINKLQQSIEERSSNSKTQQNYMLKNYQKVMMTLENQQSNQSLQGSTQNDSLLHLKAQIEENPDPEEKQAQAIHSSLMISSINQFLKHNNKSGQQMCSDDRMSDLSEELQSDDSDSTNEAELLDDKELKASTQSLLKKHNEDKDQSKLTRQQNYSNLPQKQVGKDEVDQFFTTSKICLRPNNTNNVVIIKKKADLKPNMNTLQPNPKPAQILKKISFQSGLSTGRRLNHLQTDMASYADSNKQRKEIILSSLQQHQLSFKKKKRFGAKRATGNILCTLPKNLKEQEELFFEAGCTKNPIFQYENINATQNYVNDFQFKEDPELLKIAIKIMDAFVKDYGSEQHFLQREGRILSIEETEEYFQEYIGNLELEDYLSLNFTHNAIAPTSITHCSGKKSKITICLPIDYSEGRIHGVMHHEIGTHYLRKFNDKQQHWHGKRQIFNMEPSLDTEEGLACVNQQLEYTCYTGNKFGLKPYLFRPALYYYCCHYSQTLSFVELYAKLGQYITDPHRRWKFVMRVKRGIVNTEEPGGFYKDQVYLRGAIDILRNRKNFDFEDLYCGKIALADVLLIHNDLKQGKAVDRYRRVKLQKEGIKLPSFFKDRELYTRAIEEIAKINFIECLNL